MTLDFDFSAEDDAFRAELRALLDEFLPNDWQGIFKDGDRIPESHTTVPLEFSELLRSASAVLSALPPGAVGTIVHESATALEGRTESLRQLATAGDKLTETLASRTAALDRIAKRSP